MADTMTLQAADGHGFDSYLAQPSGTPKAGLVVIQEIFGVNGHIRSVADGYAADGFLAVAPALFDRVERKVELGYGEADVAAGRDLKAAVGWDQVALDVAAAVEAAGSAGKVGIVGYCWGGSIAWLAACRTPVAVAVGYYGGQIGELIDEQPRCPVQLHFGDRDAMIPLSSVEAITAAHPGVEVHRYDADHGFNCDQRGTYHGDSATQARGRSLAFLADHLT